MRGVLMTDEGPRHWDEFSRSWITRSELERRSARWRREQQERDRAMYEGEAKPPQELEVLEFTP